MTANNGSGIVFSTDAIRQGISPEHSDIAVCLFDLIDSTNSEAKRMFLSGDHRDKLILSLGQTDGKGRLGRSFYSPSQSGLYMTLAVTTDRPLADILGVTVAASVAVLRAVKRNTGLTLGIKWVNDLYLNGRKIAGILCEAPRGTDGSLLGIITGIGINIHTEEFPEEIRNTAGSLNRPELDKNVLTAALTNRLMYWSRHLCDPRLLSAYKAHSFLLGKQVSFLHNGAEISGTAVDINDDGNLVVEADRTYVLSSGEVSLCGWNAE